jgi:hypothetical protein
MPASDRLAEVERLATEYETQGESLSIHPGHGKDVARICRAVLALVKVARAARLQKANRQGTCKGQDEADDAIDDALANLEKELDHGNG